MHSHEHAYLNMILLNNGFEHACLMSITCLLESFMLVSLPCFVAALDDVI